MQSLANIHKACKALREDEEEEEEALLCTREGAGKRRQKKIVATVAIVNEINRVKKKRTEWAELLQVAFTATSVARTFLQTLAAESQHRMLPKRSWWIR